MTNPSKTDTCSTNDSAALLTTEEAAALLNCTKRMLEVRRLRGGGPRFVRMSKRAIRYRREDLERWISERLVSTS